mmetsp:Transcript_82798/g.239258  ORF Transcript_82798/g.239258 Transcript_82798/m.239258 type:complete len:508 (-) Transcript_82798:154-1677(-)
MSAPWLHLRQAARARPAFAALARRLSSAAAPIEGSRSWLRTAAAGLGGTGVLGVGAVIVGDQIRPGLRQDVLSTFSRQWGPEASPVEKPRPKYRVVIVGGGSAGVSVASQLLRKLPASQHGEVVVIEPRDTHYYYPYWTMVGGLGLDVKDSGRPMAMMIPSGVAWVKDWVATFDPTHNRLQLAGGGDIEYDVLVVAAGLSQQFDKVQGLKETLGKNGVASIYSHEYAPSVWKNVQGMKSGKAIFTAPSTQINCGGAPQKVAYLAECAWRNAGVRGDIDISYITGEPAIFKCPTYRVELEKLMVEKGIQYSVQTDLIKVDGKAKVATFRTAGGEMVTKPFDFLHVVPPMGAPEFVQKSPLANAKGFVEVDRDTCQHKRFPNVYSLGDVSDLPTSKTYAAIAGQAPAVVHNVMKTLEGQKAAVSYDGYTACPLLLGDNKLMLAEFNGYTLDPSPSFRPLNQLQGWGLFFVMKRYIFPQVYWHLMPLGRWFGKNTIFDPSLRPAAQAQAA